MIKPNSPTPGMDLPMVGGGRFSLVAEKPATFTMIVVYRGLHCPICKTYLRALNGRIGEFEAVGVGAVAVSSDTVDRAGKAKVDWELDKLRLAYDLSIKLGREWGLFVSRGISEKEPPEFVEPGLFLVRPDNTLYAASIQTMPFTRPSLSEILGAVQFVTKNSYPARGEA
ncbi:MAG: AhpC/TSA family protein [Alphaproteobacteria bacterium]|nr:AhpC/TSA family protein [Alphaproteobacteria bacterium]MDE2496077.1 AhpC/TSA family protein [Alphaproteobacteria bacterium]